MSQDDTPKLSELTRKQGAFCQAMLTTNNASEAYRAAYDAGRMSAATVHRKAHDVLENGKIAARLAELRAPAAELAQITLCSHLDALKAVYNAALAAGQYSAAVAAEVARGKAGGLYVVKVDTDLKVGLGPNWQALIGAKIEDDD
jgi:phage terminase small subunit